VLIFLYGIIEAFSKKRVAGDNPWGEGATTLEWTAVLAAAVPPVLEELPRIK
jgi:cytochrome c oxidase subunit 1